MQSLEAILAPDSIVAIIDDDPNDAALEELLVEEAGFTPQRLEGPFDAPAQIVEAVKNCGAVSAICDHRLLHGYAAFFGAEAVAELIGNRIPAFLVTQFYDMDIDTSIRRWRSKVPFIVGRDELDDEIIRSAIEGTFREIEGDLMPNRRPYTALVRVDSMSKEGGSDVLDVVVPQWNPNRAVRFPLELIEEDVRGQIQPGTRLIATVNTGADEPADLYFEGFQIAPAPEGIYGDQ